MAGKAVVSGVGWVPMNNWMSPRVKGADMVSVMLEQYLPGRSRKKNAIQTRSSIAWSLGDPPWETEFMQGRIETGRERTLPGGLYSFV